MIATTRPRQNETPVGAEVLNDLFDELFPLMRSITGGGLRQSFEVFARYMPLEFDEVASGTKVFDWIAPKEWLFRSARLETESGETIVDAADNNLHVLNYSQPVEGVFSLEELEPHLHTRADLPDAIPYVTSYYAERWGFCMTHRQKQALKQGRYRVRIDTELRDGAVPFAHTSLPGETSTEILLTSYLCHPSLANNELSGPLVLLGLHDRIKRWPRRRFTYRFLLNPETIGALCHLHKRRGIQEETLGAGLVLTCLGGPQREISYKESRRGDSLLDKLFQRLANGRLAPLQAAPIKMRAFDPTEGSDERQYCSPGFDWPMGQAARTVYGQYAGYHNSLDTKEFMDIGRLVNSIDGLEELLQMAEIGGRFVNLSPHGEPQLGRRNLYPTINHAPSWTQSSDELTDQRHLLKSLLWILSGSDGETDMITIAERLGADLRDLRPAIEILEREGLLKFNEAGFKI